MIKEVNSIGGDSGYTIREGWRGWAGVGGAAELNLTNTAKLVAWQAKYAPDDPYACASEMNVFDFEGKLNLATANVPAFYGARRVENLLLNSCDFGAVTWVSENIVVTENQTIAPDGTLTADKIVGVGASFIADKIDTTDGDYIISGWVKSAGLGNDTFRLYLNNSIASVNFTATSDWQRFSLKSTVSTAIQPAHGLARDSLNNDVDLYCWGFQLEDVTGQANQNPSNHIPTTSTAVTEYYTTENGNTVSSNVVTEARGDDLTNIMGLAFWPSTTNVIGSAQYRDFTHADWNVTNGSVSAGAVTLIDGTSVSDKNTFTASGANGAIILDPYTSASGVHAGGVFIKRKTGTGKIYVTVDSGTTWVEVTTQVAGDSGWHLCQTTLPTVTDPEFGVKLEDSGDAVYLDWAQMDDGYSRVSVHPISGGTTLATQSLVAADADNASKLISDTKGYTYAEAMLMPDDIGVGASPYILWNDSDTGFIAGYKGVEWAQNNDGTNSLLLTQEAFSGYSKIASYWWDSSKAITASGLSATGNYDGEWGAGALIVGGRVNAAYQWNGIISKVIFGVNQKTTQAKMEAETTPGCVIPIGYTQVVDSEGKNIVDENGDCVYTPR